MTYFDKLLLDLKLLNDAITVLIFDLTFIEELEFDMAAGEISDEQNRLHKLLNMRLKAIEFELVDDSAVC